jgi:integrase/recombinase XerD
MMELREALEEYLEVRRRFGFKLRIPGSLLGNFIAYAEKEGASFITRELALRWATQPKNCQPCQWANRLSMVRTFARYVSASDPRTEIPPDGLLPHRFHRKSPYLYTDAEIACLIEAARQLPSSRGLRAATYGTLFGLLAVTGMRMSEPIALDRDDVDLTQGILTVRRTKFGKSRIVPIHASTVQELRKYLQLRDRLFPLAHTRSLFISERGTRLTEWSVRWTFVQLSQQIGLRGPNDSHGPRLHDLRHRFAIKTLLRWYRGGVNVEQHLPELSAYLGHVHVADTYWYISAVPELLRIGKRLRYCVRGSVSVTHNPPIRYSRTQEVVC